MFSERLREVRQAVCATAASVDVDTLDHAGAQAAVREWTAIINSADAARAMAAACVAECGTPAGSSDAADWFARNTGSTSTTARQKLRAGKGMRRQSGTRTRATQGALSPEQAAAISDAVDSNPDAEDRLLDVADGSSLSELRDECAKTKAAADPDPDATERRIHRQRRVRRWRDREGAEHLHAVGTKAAMAKLDLALKPLLDEIFKANRGAGEREPFEAYTFDALIGLATSGATVDRAVDAKGQPKPRYLGLLRIDWTALLRGSVEGDETCEIAGLGPIPVATARELLGESILKLVITKGSDVGNVTHLGRGANTAQKIALLWQQPVCTRQGCGRRLRLENDHRDDYARVRCTELGKLDPLCHHDHALKTYKGWALVEGNGVRPMVPPDDPRHPRHKRRQAHAA